MTKHDEQKTLHPYPSIRESLALAFPPSVPVRSRYLVVITGYFDESGTHDGSDNITVAGFLATEEQWIEFGEKWAEALVTLDIPTEASGVRMFHMAEFAHRLGAFTRDEWPESRRRETLKVLLKIVADHVGASVGVTVPRSQYEAQLSEVTRRFYGSPYGLAATTIIANVSTRAHEMHPDPWVAYVYESGAKGRHEFDQRLTPVINDHRSQEVLRALSLRFENKRQFLPLQAADILAYELHLNWQRRGTRVGPESRHPLRELGQMPHLWQYTDPETLQQIDTHILKRAAEEIERRGLNDGAR